MKEWFNKNFWNLMFWLATATFVLGYVYPEFIDDFDSLYSSLIMAISIGFDRLEKRISNV